MDETYLTLRLDFIVCLDGEVRIVYQRSFDRTAHTTVAPLPGFATAVAPGAALVTHPDIRSHREGVLVLPGAMLLVASQPVTGSQSAPQAVGAVVFGRILDAAEMAHLSGIVQQDTHLARPDDPSLLPGERAALTRPDAGLTPFVFGGDRRACRRRRPRFQQHPHGDPRIL